MKEIRGPVGLILTSYLMFSYWMLWWVIRIRVYQPLFCWYTEIEKQHCYKKSQHIKKRCATLRVGVSGVLWKGGSPELLAPSWKAEPTAGSKKRSRSCAEGWKLPTWAITIITANIHKHTQICLWEDFWWRWVRRYVRHSCDHLFLITCIQMRQVLNETSIGEVC